MTTSSDTRKPQRHHVAVTGLTTSQSVLDRPTRPSADAAAPGPSESERRFSRPRWLAATAAVAALAMVGAIALSVGEEVDQVDASTPRPELVTSAGVSTVDGYWNPYTLQWVPFQPASTTPAADGYWNPYTLEWIPFED